MANKLYYSMGEVTEMFDVEASLIRYWCSQFSCLRPKRNAKGNRLFSPQDVERLKRIHHLLKEKKMTIEGAQKAMRKRNIEAEKDDSDIKLLEQLQSLRAMLVDMRNNIGEPLPEEDIEEQVAEVQPVVEVVEEPVAEVVEEPTIEEVKEVTIDDIFEAPTTEPTVAEQEVEVVAEPTAEVVAEPTAEPTAEPQAVKRAAPKKKRAPRRKLIGEEGVVERPLFPFYEQTLF